MNQVEFTAENEGFRDKPYKCTAGKLTIGYGWNIEDTPISKEAAEFILKDQLADATADMMTIFPDLFDFTDEQRIALVDMRFQLGPGGFRKFKKMIAAIKEGNWEKAATEAKDSRWYFQTMNRAKRVVALFRNDWEDSHV